MRRCSACEGFVPKGLRVCPHCDAAPSPTTWSVSRAAHRVAMGAMASSAAMTLMACYGAPCSSAEECAGGSFDDGGIGTDGYSETCDPDTPSEALDGELPLSVDGSLSGEGTNQGTCGGQGAELVYTWTPPSAGTYRFSTSGPADTVLYLRDREPLSCGMELGCDDDGGDGSSSTVTADLTGTPITIVVDSWSNTGGDFTLTIESP